MKADPVVYWRPITAEDPPAGVLVLVCWDRGSASEGYRSAANGSWYTQDALCDDEDPTHWAPLPSWP